ncbi:MAG: hypothetical protein R2939_07605 [Kofleriaceae bacterium]
MRALAMAIAAVGLTAGAAVAAPTAPAIERGAGISAPGLGGSGGLVFSPSSFDDFGVVELGRESAPQTFRLTNTSTMPLDVELYLPQNFAFRDALCGPDPTERDTYCFTTLASQGFIDVDVSFTPFYVTEWYPDLSASGTAPDGTYASAYVYYKGPSLDAYGFEYGPSAELSPIDLGGPEPYASYFYGSASPGSPDLRVARSLTIVSDAADVFAFDYLPTGVCSAQTSTSCEISANFANSPLYFDVACTPPPTAEDATYTARVEYTLVNPATPSTTTTIASIELFCVAGHAYTMATPEAPLASWTCEGEPWSRELTVEATGVVPLYADDEPELTSGADDFSLEFDPPGPSGTDFFGEPSFGYAIHPGNEASALLTLAPAAAVGSYAAKVTWPWTNRDATVQDLTVDVLPAGAHASETAVAFGEVAVGQVAQRTLALKVCSDDAVEVLGMSVPTGFVAGPSTFALTPTGEAPITILFAPMTTGAFAGPLVVHTSLGDVTVELSGDGADGEPGDTGDTSYYDGCLSAGGGGAAPALPLVLALGFVARRRRR